MRPDHSRNIFANKPVQVHNMTAFNLQLTFNTAATATAMTATNTNDTVNVNIVNVNDNQNENVNATTPAMPATTNQEPSAPVFVMDANNGNNNYNNTLTAAALRHLRSALCVTSPRPLLATLSAVAALVRTAPQQTLSVLVASNDHVGLIDRATDLVRLHLGANDSVRAALGLAALHTLAALVTRGSPDVRAECARRGAVGAAMAVIRAFLHAQNNGHSANGNPKDAVNGHNGKDAQEGPGSAGDVGAQYKRKRTVSQLAAEEARAHHQSEHPVAVKYARGGGDGAKLPSTAAVHLVLCDPHRASDPEHRSLDDCGQRQRQPQLQHRPENQDHDDRDQGGDVVMGEGASAAANSGATVANVVDAVDQPLRIPIIPPPTPAIPRPSPSIATATTAASVAATSSAQPSVRHLDVYLALQVLLGLGDHPTVRALLRKPTPTSNAASTATADKPAVTCAYAMVEPLTRINNAPLVRDTAIAIMGQHAAVATVTGLTASTEVVNFDTLSSSSNNGTSSNGRYCANLACSNIEPCDAVDAHACSASGAAFARCGRCRSARYCSKSCQVAAWAAGHRYWCGTSSPSSSSDLSSSSLSSSSVSPMPVKQVQAMELEKKEEKKEDEEKKLVAAFGGERPKWVRRRGIDSQETTTTTTTTRTPTTTNTTTATMAIAHARVAVPVVPVSVPVCGSTVAPATTASMLGGGFGGVGGGAAMMMMPMGMPAAGLSFPSFSGPVSFNHLSPHIVQHQVQQQQFHHVHVVDAACLAADARASFAAAAAAVAGNVIVHHHHHHHHHHHAGVHVSPSMAS